MSIEEIMLKYKKEIGQNDDSIDNKDDQPGSSKESSSSSSQSSKSASKLNYVFILCC